MSLLLPSWSKPPYISPSYCDVFLTGFPTSSWLSLSPFLTQQVEWSIKTLKASLLKLFKLVCPLSLPILHCPFLHLPHSISCCSPCLLYMRHPSLLSVSPTHLFLQAPSHLRAFALAICALCQVHSSPISGSFPHHHQVHTQILHSWWGFPGLAAIYEIVTSRAFISYFPSLLYFSLWYFLSSTLLYILHVSFVYSLSLSSRI